MSHLADIRPLAVSTHATGKSAWSAAIRPWFHKAGPATHVDRSRGGNAL